MKDFLSKFKIPTLLGLGLIFLGLGSGLYLTLREQLFISKAAPDVTPQKITVTNITSDSAAISWQTNPSTLSFVTFGQNNSSEQTVLDDQDAQAGTGPKPHLFHYATLKNLLPKTKYQFKIISGKINSEIQTLETAEPLASQTNFSPIIGSVLDGNTPLEEGVVYLSIPGAVNLSSPIKPGGNFLIPLSQVAKSDTFNNFPLTEDINAKLTIESDKGQASVLFKIATNMKPLSTIKLGENLDFTTQEPTPQPTPDGKDLERYDLNNDGKINSADNAVILQNFGKKGKNIKGDLNKDEVVNQKDLDLMTQKLKELGSQ